MVRPMLSTACSATARSSPDAAGAAITMRITERPGPDLVGHHREELRLLGAARWRGLLRQALGDLRARVASARIVAMRRVRTSSTVSMTMPMSAVNQIIP